MIGPSAKSIARDYLTAVVECENPQEAVDLLAIACRRSSAVECASVEDALAFFSIVESALWGIRGGLAGLVVSPDADEFAVIQEIADTTAELQSRALRYLASTKSPIRHQPIEYFFPAGTNGIQNRKGA